MYSYLIRRQKATSVNLIALLLLLLGCWAMLLLWLFKSNNYILSVAQPWIPLYFCSCLGVCSVSNPTNIRGYKWGFGEVIYVSQHGPQNKSPQTNTYLYPLISLTISQLIIPLIPDLKKSKVSVCNFPKKGSTWKTQLLENVDLVMGRLDRWAKHDKAICKRRCGFDSRQSPRSASQSPIQSGGDSDPTRTRTES